MDEVKEWEERAQAYRAARHKRRMDLLSAAINAPKAIAFGTTGGAVVVLDQGIDTSTPAGRLFFNVIGAIAEFEHSLIVERTKQGLDAARARGRTGGQKPKLKPRQIKLAQEMYEETGADGKRRYTVQQIADELGVSRPTIYRHLEKKSA
ncbi:recombinase family protein [Streptomyces albogriseolus]|uniref:recombinase family protein n=1 Tax=Streptomyces TaxID=1883 RepID=UPI001C70685D|nr:recombinase family protein [Streptomyces viridodiastaticus]